MAAAERRDAGKGADVDNASLAGSEHSTAALLAAAEAAADECSHHFLHLLQGNVFRRAKTRLSRDVSEDIDSAKFLVYPCEHCADLVDVTNVTGDRYRLATKGFDLGGGVCHSFRVDVCEDKVGARLRETDGHRFAHSAGGSGDKGYTIGEVEYRM
jgi:hypothetical protein